MNINIKSRTNHPVYLKSKVSRYPVNELCLYWSMDNDAYSSVIKSLHNFTHKVVVEHSLNVQKNYSFTKEQWADPSIELIESINDPLWNTFNINNRNPTITTTPTTNTNTNPTPANMESSSCYHNLQPK